MRRDIRLKPRPLCPPTNPDFLFWHVHMYVCMNSHPALFPWGSYTLSTIAGPIFLLSRNPPLHKHGCYKMFTWILVLVVKGFVQCISLLCCMHSHLVVSDSLWPHGLQPTRLLCLWEFSRQEYWSGLPCPSPGDLPTPGIEPRSPVLQAFFTIWAPGS